MSETPGAYDIYLEIGERKTFAGAMAWPGWCRPGRDEQSAIQALLDAGPRYSKILQPTEVEFEAPTQASAFTVIERLTGNSTTDFGAPNIPPSSDDDPIAEEELQRFQHVLQGCWLAFDNAVTLATGKELRKGPRGGGRELDGIIDHVIGADVSYLRALGWKVKDDEDAQVKQRLARIREGILEGLTAAAGGELPTEGPRGGKRWVPRYFVRRVAWHVVDHAWEIENRIM